MSYFLPKNKFLISSVLSYLYVSCLMGEKEKNINSVFVPEASLRDKSEVRAPLIKTN